MMEIRPRHSLIEDPQATDTRRSLPDHADRRAGRNGAGVGDGMHAGQFGLHRDFLGDREQAFAQRLNHALHDSEPGEDAAGSDDGARLLAVAGLVPLPTAPLHNPPAEKVAEAPRLDAMIERIEKAVLARSIDTLPGAVSLTLDFGDIGGSIGGVTITLAAGSIDLLLSRTGEVAAGPYLQAAQMLADRLHARFPNRVVRILEAPARRETAPEGLAAFSRLLDPSGDAS